jgi:hypothetical protein
MALSNAEKQAQHRARHTVTVAQLEAFREALTQALEATEGRSAARLVRGLSDHPGEWLPELTRRLGEVKLITARRPAPKARRPLGMECDHKGGAEYHCPECCPDPAGCDMHRPGGPFPAPDGEPDRRAEIDAAECAEERRRLAGLPPECESQACPSCGIKPWGRAPECPTCQIPRRGY